MHTGSAGPEELRNVLLTGLRRRRLQAGEIEDFLARRPRTEQIL